MTCLLETALVPLGIRRPVAAMPGTGLDLPGLRPQQQSLEEDRVFGGLGVNLIGAAPVSSR